MSKPLRSRTMGLYLNEWFKSFKKFQSFKTF
jgi:hypothetical protein